MSGSRSGPVVAGVDHSATDRTAVVLAAWEAENRGVPLRIVHGYLVPTPCLTPLAPVLDERTLVVAARDQLAQIAQTVRARRPRLPITTVTVRADGAEALIRESASAGLVVVGGPRLRGFAGSPIGSVAGHVVAGASCPVLVVPRPEVVPAPLPGFGPVLVGIDGWPASELVLQFGFEEASARGVPLVAVHVWAQQQESAERTLAEALAGWQQRYPQVSIRRRVEHGVGTARALLDVAREISADLIVVGSRGRGAVTGAVLGSVSQVLINHAGTPVGVIGPMVVPNGCPGLGSVTPARA